MYIWAPLWIRVLPFNFVTSSFNDTGYNGTGHNGIIITLWHQWFKSYGAMYHQWSLLTITKMKNLVSVTHDNIIPIITQWTMNMRYPRWNMQGTPTLLTESNAKIRNKESLIYFAHACHWERFNTVITEWKLTLSNECVIFKNYYVINCSWWTVMLTCCQVFLNMHQVWYLKSKDEVKRSKNNNNKTVFRIWILTPSRLFFLLG